MTNERAFEDPVYFVAVPFALELDILRLSLRPFYYFKNKSYIDGLRDSSALGINAQVRVCLNEDRVNGNYLYTFLGASFAQQKGTAFYTDGTMENGEYSQAAYTLSLSQTLYNAFEFDVEGAVFQYPDGVSNLTAYRGVMNQEDLAGTQTLDIVHQLAKYTVGARMSRLWAENGSSAYISYRYGEYHTAQPEHSILGGISFRVTPRIVAEVVYNHVRTVHHQNKRDIGSVRLSTFF